MSFTSTIWKQRTGLVSLVLVIINVCVFIQVYKNQDNLILANSNHILDNGGLMDALLLKGQWWRLLSSMFIHNGIIHLAVNMLSILSIGRDFEKSFGKIALLITYLVSGLLGSLFSANFNLYTASCGASGAIFGIVGAFIALHLFVKDRFLKSNRKEISNLFYILVLNIVFSFLAKGIDLYAHLGGLLGGFLVGFAMSPTFSKNQDSIVIRYLAYMASAAVIMLFIFLPITIPSYRIVYYEIFQSFASNDMEVVDILNNPVTYQNKQVTKANVLEATSICKKNLKMLQQLKKLPPALKQDANILKKYNKIRIKSLG